MLVTKAQDTLVNGARAQVIRLEEGYVEIEVDGTGSREA
jgi:hypothetical protein